MPSGGVGGARGPMAGLDPSSMQRLAAMGIEVWRERSEPAPSGSEQAGVESIAGGARIRLSSGDGDWLLVQHAPWRGAHESLLADIIATIGVERVRFGQWARGSAAGESLDELAPRGIRRVLSLGPAPEDISDERVIVAPTLDALAAEGSARKALWQALAPQLHR